MKYAPSVINFVIFCLGIIASLVLPAQSANIKIKHSSNDMLVVSLSGDIKLEDDNTLFDIFYDHEKAAAKIIHLNSRGGQLVTSIVLGELIRSYGARTVIPNGAKCLSSCSVVFLGGWDKSFNRPYRQKHQNSRLGVHRHITIVSKKTFRKKLRKTLPQITQKEANRLLELAKENTTAELRDYIDRMGVNSIFFKKWMQTPNRKLHRISNSALMKMGKFRIFGTQPKKVEHWENNISDCSIKGHYQDNEIVTIGYERRTGWYIHLQNFQLLKNSQSTSLPTEVFIDRDRIFNGSRTLGDNNDVRISIGENPVLERSLGNGKFKIIGSAKTMAQKISEGNTLRFVINYSSEPYSMSGTRKAIQEITECIRSTEISGSGVNVTQEPPIAEPNIEDSEAKIDIAELTRSLQLELKRVGCDPGVIDGEWGNKTQSAWDRFNKFSNLDLTIGQPTEFALETIKSYNKKVCPVSKKILANKNIQLPQTQIPKKSKCRFPSSNACIQNCMSTGSSVHPNAHFRCVSECQQSGC